MRTTRFIPRCIALTAFASALLVSNATWAAPATHCTVGETVAFSCDVGRKTVSVCISHRNPASISYRYGRIGAAEMTMTSTGNDGKVFAGGVRGQGNGSGQQIRFKNGDWSYIVFEMSAGNLTDVPGKTFASLTILKGSPDDKPIEHGKSANEKTVDCNGERWIGDMDNPAIAKLAHAELDEFLAWW